MEEKRLEKYLNHVSIVVGLTGDALGKSLGGI